MGISMKKTLTTLLCIIFSGIVLEAQLSAAITSWLQNTTTTGTYYVAGNSTPLSNGILVNCQAVQYSTNNVYISTKGIPAYTTGPFLDGNPSQASNQNAIFKFPLSPVQNTGTPTATTGGNIGVFINGVALFDYRDGISWNFALNKLCGGPIVPPCTGDGVWNRDAVLAEMDGFDCSKGHPAMGNYHHHQNPSPFDLDLVVLSTICSPYDANGLYAINSSQHSPLLGFAYDGFPIYGAYAYTNTNGTGAIARMKSGYQLRNITVRTHYANGSNVTDGPPVSATYPLGYFREDYEYIAHPGQGDYLDDHNGRFCITPEYPNGTYAYFCTVNADHNSAYPYAVGPTFYGVWANRKVANITEPVTAYVPPALPVSFIDFRGSYNPNGNMLEWQTDNEQNADYFSIEGSINGTDFETIATVKCKNDPAGPHDYTLTDHVLSAPVVYYRIKQVDMNGQYRYSVIITVAGTTTQQLDFKVYPNPATDLVYIQFNALLKKDAVVSLWDMNGRTVTQKTMYQGTTSVFFDTQSLYAGAYWVTVKEEGRFFIQPIIIKKEF